MFINDEVMTLIGVSHKSGTSKTGKPYDFFLASLGDDQFNRFEALVSDSLKTFDGKLVPLLQTTLEANENAVPTRVVVNLSVVPRGFRSPVALPANADSQSGK